MGFRNYLGALLEHENEKAKDQSTARLNDIYTQRVEKGDYRLAEGLSWLSSNKWEQVRNSISRGALLEARDMLAKMNPESQLEENESLFEEIRMNCYEADFTSALQNAESLLNKENLDPLSRMTCLQMKALAQFELGDALSALNTTDRILALETIYPRSQASLFGRSVRCRALNILGNKTQAQHELSELWSKISQQTYTLNVKFQLIMYCRTMTKIAVANSHSFAPYAVAGYWLAKEMNSPLHEGFFILDLMVCEDEKLREVAKKEILRFLPEYKCLERFHTQLSSLPETCEETGLEQYLVKSPTSILFLNRNYIYDFKTDSARAIDLGIQPTQILKCIGNRKLDKEEIYKCVWNSREYHPLQHDSAMRTGFKRIRNDSGIEIVSKDSLVSIPQSLIVS